LFEISDDAASHVLINCEDGTRVRVRPQSERWPAKKLQDVLKQGSRIFENAFHAAFNVVDFAGAV
jgi:hypothetical protein